MRVVRHWLLLLLLAAGGAQAAPPSLAEFSHQAWTVEEGAPADVWTLAQAPSAYLWLGTGLGLYRFDGVRFDRYPLREGQRLRSTNINALLVLPSGDIWVGLFSGGVVRLRDGMVAAFGQQEGLPGGRVLRLAQTPDGALWAAAEQGLARFDGRRWQRIGTGWNYPDAGADYVFADSQGRLWVAGREHLAWLPPHSQRFEVRHEKISRFAVLAEEPGGRIWLSDSRSGTRPLSDKPMPPSPLPENDHQPFARAKQLLFSADGSLWLSEAGVGVRRLGTPAAIPAGRSLNASDGLETFTPRQGLPSAVAVPLLQTAEGEVWVGTNNGLSSFRRQRLKTVGELSGAQRHGFVLALQADGVLASHSAQALLLDPPHAPTPQPARERLRFALRAPDGALWQVDAKGIWREHQGLRQRMGSDLAEGLLNVLALAPDRQGGAWLSISGRGVFYVGPTGSLREARVEGSGASSPTVITIGPDETVWFGYDDEAVQLSPDRKQLRRYGSGEGLLTGRTTAIHSGSAGVFVAGEAGLARLEGSRFSTLSAERDDSFGHISGIVESADGNLWLNGGRGIVQLQAADIPALFAGAHAKLNYRLLNWRDGLPGIALQAYPSPTALRDRRGRLWFATNRGIAWLHPATLTRYESPPAVEVQHLRVGDRVYRPDPRLALEPGTQNIAIRYTALTPADADRMRFRYRLEGVDDDWQDADFRREATYANLGPGDYRFRVIAANSDGVWSKDAAEISFTLPPTLVQSRPFIAACVALLLAMAWATYRLRARNIAARVRLRLEALHGERERIARELHDTLLQGTQGLIVHVQGLISRLPEHEPVRKRIEEVLDRADEVVLEARERVLDLRATALDGVLLAERLAQAGRDMAEGRDTVFRQVSLGDPRPLQRIASDELYSLAREALTNAFRHAQPRQVEIEIAFHSKELVLRIRDDGVGMSPEQLVPGARPGHWGLAGMHERAHLLGARLSVTSRPHAGTEVECRVPAAAVYLDGYEKPSGNELPGHRTSGRRREEKRP
ncbi:hypothetical protein G8A07_14705 [Roseateles sp. DAIF2]|uniref:sensor histidine kinase n=1 Tax=Roseateles sp. DAIF2 TaxID=2714952 RepID=UPI0018A32506|nr:sensor histidine kinase [Roseateles sp. DAIF2]QPF74042.1 hypothetical protein G8A07_14705 [Roseateles sp. DAIF2]